MKNLRDIDRRVAKRAWTRVRHPTLPAWAWLIIDFTAIMLITAAIGELVALVAEETGQLISLAGLLAAVVVAVFNFVLTTRTSPSSPPDSDIGDR